MRVSMKKNEQPTTLKEILLRRRGLVFVESNGEALNSEVVRAVLLEFAALGYSATSRLQARLENASLEELTALRAWACEALLRHVGGDKKHEPLFRNFPNDIPADTLDLWWKKFLIHFVQAEDQACLFCGRKGTTHVLIPCRHVVCEMCFDGSNYSACPICEHHVDRSSPFFKLGREWSAPKEKICFKLLDLGEDADAAAKALFESFCERKQALSPDDRSALITVVTEYKAQALSWLSQRIPVRENVAVVFGTLFQVYDPEIVLPIAKLHMKTATDVLRFIAVLSGTDGSLLRETVFKSVRKQHAGRFWGKIAALLSSGGVTVPLRINRFKTAKLSRPLRRALLSLLESFAFERLAEDMLRHQSYWVWVGEFLHPHEYAARYPAVARAFQIVRKKAPDGTVAPEFRTWYSRLESAVESRNTDTLLRVLAERPGEFARRFDLALRKAGSAEAEKRIVELFSQKVPVFSTPVLLTLRSHLPTRHKKAPTRIFWPKGKTAKGVFSNDTRQTLPQKPVETAVRAINAELLRRFEEKTKFDSCVIDEALRDVVVPFNERTASSSAICLPRGTRMPVPSGKWLRLFLHWCQPEKRNYPSDLDLSVAFYDEKWNYVGVCSYYQLQFKSPSGAQIAQSAGDLRDAPFPDGATEFVDVDREKALALGIKFAVMVVNNYSGMSFSQLERGFAGLMLRDDPMGKHFDPRTVELKFALDGENGVFLPLVLDVEKNELHWLDVHAKGVFDFNNVETSKQAIRQICPEMMAYFASGIRMSMFDLGLLHAAARCQRISIRGERIDQYSRQVDETVSAFYERILRREGAATIDAALLATEQAQLALLFRGDIDVPVGSQVYALIRERVSPTLAASDLIS